MQRQGKLQVAERVLVTAANMLSVRLDALIFQPIGNLVVGDHGRSASPGDGDNIADMVKMSVAQTGYSRSRFRLQMCWQQDCR